MKNKNNLEIEKLPVRVFREELGLTRPQVRQMTGIAERTLTDIENGKSLPNIKTFVALACAYKKSLKEMVAAIGLDTTNIPDDCPKNNASQT